MGTWDTGPFDNDSAADWCGALHDADPALRPELVRHALTVTAETTGYLDDHEACAAVAAAAIVASTLPGGTPITSHYAPAFLTEGGTIAFSEDFAPLAVRALTRVVGENSEWFDLWTEDGADSPDEAFAAIADLRKVLLPATVDKDQQALPL
ncbi:DUF4259 domain-containing protein [Nocardia sp. NPDC005978]|uniref:DUF4259 domain-containing protein n=1 Tax=Nocardia sp. NPDC005978 TaxID=3156725 RepID=UPI0033A9A3B6